MAINAGNVYSELILNGDKYFKTLEKADKDMKAFENKLNNYGKSMEKVGGKLTKAISVPIAGLGAMATKASIDFESAFAGVIKTVDATDTQLAKLETGIRDMSKEIPASATAIAEVAEAAGQLGIETDNILSFSRVMIDMGEATNLSADEAATSLARLANITGMSQQDFDRLGSAIVDLGNNLATTEAEIVAMGLRLAGAGSQIGLSEAQIMSFAGALSSVGIEAEAGGSAFSKVMIDMQLAVETNSERLKEFADVAGMSGEEFRKAFQEDAAGAIIAFIQGLGSAEERGLSTIKVLDDMGISEVRLRDALLRASGASDVFTESLEIGTNAWEENNALTKEAEQRYATTESKLKIAKNTLMDAARTIGDALIPHLMTLAKKVKSVAEWFSNLNPETQETIVKMAGLAAAVGPVLSIGGKMASGVSSIIGLFGKLSLGTTAATTTVASLGNAAAIGTTKVAGMGLAAKAGTLLMNPWTAAIAAGGLAAYGLYKNLSEDAIPAIDLFGEEVSESTQKAVSSFLELEEKATMALKQISWSGQEVTEEMANNISGNINSMKDQVVTVLEEQKNEALSSLEEMVNNSIDMTEEEKDEILRITEESYDEQIHRNEVRSREISEILQKASEENRELKQEERERIEQLQEGMREDAVRILSDSEAEQLAIMERLKAESGKISALQAAEIVQNSLEQKEQTIAEAEEEYNERLKYAAQLRESGSKEAEEMADKIVEEAERQKEGAIENAELMHDKVIEQAKLQSEEHVNEIDWTTGEVLSEWDVMVNDVTEKAKEIKDNVLEKAEELKMEFPKKIEELKTDAAEKFSDMANSAIQWGKDVVNGFIDGVNSLKDRAVYKVEEVGNRISTGFKNILGIASPSKVFAEYGKFTVAGYVKGIEDNKYKAIKSVEDMGRMVVSEYDRLGNAVITALKNKYREEERMQLDSLRRQTENIRRETDERLKQYDRELKAKLEVLNLETSEEERKIQEQIDAINNKTKQEEKELREQEYQNRITAKEKELLEAKSAEERLRIQQELNAMRAEKEREALLESRQRQIAALQDEMSKIRQQAADKRQELELEYQAKKQNEEDKLNAVITSLENEMEATKTHYSTLLEEERLQAQARTLILDENNQELVALLETYNPHWQNAGQSFGESLLAGLNSTKQSIQDAVDEILSMVGQADRAAASVHNQNSLIIEAKRDWERAYKIGDKSGMEEANRRAEEARSKGGTIGADITLQDALKRIGQNAHGTNYWRGGLTWVGEQGPELIELPKSTKVYSNEKSERMVQQGRSITQNITINSPEPLSPSEIARKNLQVSRQLAMEWGL